MSSFKKDEKQQWSLRRVFYSKKWCLAKAQHLILTCPNNLAFWTALPKKSIGHCQKSKTLQHIWNGLLVIYCKHVAWNQFWVKWNFMWQTCSNPGVYYVTIWHWATIRPYSTVTQRCGHAHPMASRNQWREGMLGIARLPNTPFPWVIG